MKFRYKYLRGDSIAYKSLDGQEIEINASTVSANSFAPPTRFSLNNGQLLIDSDELVIETQEQAIYLRTLALRRRILGK